MAYEFRVQINGISKPPVWRKLKVPENFSFHNFHLAIQNAFGWDNCHLYEFSEHGYGSIFSIQLPHEESEPEEMSSRKTKLNQIFKNEREKFIYLYDFGDDWAHRITLEGITQEKITRPSCIGGKGKCPPEDCGGIHGYQLFLKIISNPKDPEYESMREWAWLPEGKEWNVNEFDLEKAKNRVNMEEYSR